MSADCQSWLQFCEKFGDAASDEVMTRIADASWSYDKKREDVQFCQRHQINACNHIYGGRVLHEGIWYVFVLESGDRNGTVVMEWGDEDADEVSGYFEEPRPTVYKLVPRDDGLVYSSAMFRAYLAWTKEKWFSEMESGYNYDRHFAPGGKTEQYWRDKAGTKGLKYVASETHGALLGKFNSMTDAERAEWIATTRQLQAEFARMA